MHLDFGLTKTINRATHVTRGFRRIVMVTGANDGHRLIADLTDEFTRRGIEVSQLPIGGSEDTAPSRPAPARTMLEKWSRRLQESAHHTLDESLDHQSAIIVSGLSRLDEVARLQIAGQPDRPVVVALATDPVETPDELPELVDAVVTTNPQTDPWEHLDVPVYSIGVPAHGANPSPSDRPKRIVLLGPCIDEQLADGLAAFDDACQVVPGWTLEVCLDESRARSAIAARRDVGIHSAGSENTIMNQSELALVMTRTEDLASRILDAAGAGLPAVAYAATPAAADILSRCGYPATDELSSALAQGMADAPLRRIQRESIATVLADHASKKIGDAWLDLMFNVGRNRR